ncbi:MAG: hypothetical protein RL007_2897 [Bacteroidota bacterium]|jgi:hypothetical protein
MKRVLFAVFLVAVTVSVSCKKEAKDPTLTLKTGAGYTSTDVNVAPGSTIKVGVICDAGTDPLHISYSEVAYDGANVDSLVVRYEIPEGQNRYEADYIFTVRNRVGTERWTFNVNDKDGRLVEKEIRIVVQ